MKMSKKQRPHLFLLVASMMPLVSVTGELGGRGKWGRIVWSSLKYLLESQIVRELERESCQIVKYLGDGLAVTVYESYVRCISMLHKSSPMLQVTGCASKTHCHPPETSLETQTALLENGHLCYFCSSGSMIAWETHIKIFNSNTMICKKRIKCPWEFIFFNWVSV